MASAFSSQLQTIAAKSSNELDLRAQRDAHAESIIFEHDVAVKQGWDSLYEICVQGFQELCLLDQRLQEFDQTLFSVHSKDQDRDQLNKVQNNHLNGALEKCLSILSSRLLLRPGVQTLEWLVRRFKVHVHNSEALLLGLLLYHEHSIFQNVLSIIPTKALTQNWKFLAQYRQHNTVNIPRHVIVYTLTNNDGLFTTFNNYAVKTCQDRTFHASQMRFWGGLVVEAVAERLKQSISGRKEIQRQRMEDLLLKLLPVLNDGFDIRDCSEMHFICLSICIMLASTAELDDRVLDSLMEAVATTITYGDVDPRSCLKAIVLLASHKEGSILPRRVSKTLIRLPNLFTLLQGIHNQNTLYGFSVAFVQTILRRLSQKNYLNTLRFLEDFMLATPLIIDDIRTGQLLNIITAHLKHYDDSQQGSIAIRNETITMLRNLSLKENLISSFSAAMRDQDESDIDMETVLGTILPISDNSRLLIEGTPDVDNMDSVESASRAFASVPERSKETSFLSGQTSCLFDTLESAFRSTHSRPDLIQTFRSLPLWQSKPNPTLWLSFLLRVACSHLQDQYRSLAINILGEFAGERSDVDSQVFIPYLSIFLADNATSVRRAASRLALAMEKSAPKSLVEGEDCERFGGSDIYNLETMSKISWCSSSNLVKIIQQVYLPSIEECVLDPSQIGKSIKIALNGKPSSIPSDSKTSSVEIKKNLKHSLFAILTSHAVATPLLKVKTGIINLFDGVHKVGSSNKTKDLSPLLHEWMQTSSEAAAQHTELEGLQMDFTDNTMVQLISPLDNESINHVLHVIAENGTGMRTQLLETIFDRIALIWNSLKDEIKTTMSIQIYDLSFNSVSGVAGCARAFLQNASLPSETLAMLLEQTCAGWSDMPSEGPPKKVRRTSRGREITVRERTLEVQTLTSRISLALELIHDSRPGKRPELMGNLFEVLPILRRLKDQERVESPYLFCLCLSSILGIVDHARTLQKPNLDLSRIRADLVADLVRTAENPQVQSIALLLSASLAGFAPQKVLHNIMPIFTFMGTTILSQDDEHSVHVVNQAIDHIIPPMVSNIRKQNPNNLILSTSDLVSSFVAAFDHVPQQRRIKLFRRLIARLGPEDFGFVIIAMLLSHRADEESVKSFSITLLAEFSPLVQIVTYSKLIDLINDLYSQDYHLVEPLLNISEGTVESEMRDLTLALFAIGQEILKSKNLLTAMRKINKIEAFTSESLKKQLNLCFYQILKVIKMSRQKDGELLAAAKNCFPVLLQLPPLSETFQMLPNFLTETSDDSDDFRTYALHVFTAHLRSNHPNDVETQNAAINFLKELGEALKGTQVGNVKQAMIACIDQIVENYGRKHIETVIDIAITMSGEPGLSSSDRRVSIASMLCLASMLECLGEAAVPVASAAMPTALTLLGKEVGLANSDSQLHDAVYALIASFITHVPFFVSEDALCRIVGLSAESTGLDLHNSSVESRQETLSLLANNIELSTLLDSLNKTWFVTVENDIKAVLEYLRVLEVAIENKPKSEIIRHADQISALIIQALDLRRVQFTYRDEDSYAEKDVVQIESKINTITIKFIYKLNDTVFRPVFENWVDWAIQCTDLTSPTEKARMLRQTSLFGFLTHFFETLKSIVTSYSSYVVEPVNTILKHLHDVLKETTPHSNNPNERQDQSNFYTSVLSTLKASFTHDADGFYNAPSHFSPLCDHLVSQLELSGIDTKKHQQQLNPVIETHLIPTIVSFAMATLDIPSHHHKINHNLYNLRHHESAAVRMASVKTHIALTESEEVGDEWINHVVVGTTGEAGGGGSSDTMIYVNEMLEDDDEDVEAEVRRWVRMVRDKVGENVFED